jgi:hypothetical protein
MLLLVLSLRGVAQADAKPPACPPRAAAAGGDVGPLFDLLHVDRLERLKAHFSEEKRIALLARPLRSTGALYFDRTRGIARVTTTPRAERVILSTTSLRIERDKKVEEIPLDKSKALKAFSLVFPRILRGERAELEAAFALDLQGKAKEAWTLVLTPTDPALCGLVSRVVLSGQGAEVASLQVVEANGDTTETRLSDVAKNDAVPAAEVAQGFGVGAN